MAAALSVHSSVTLRGRAAGPSTSLRPFRTQCTRSRTGQARSAQHTARHVVQAAAAAEEGDGSETVTLQGSVVLVRQMFTESKYVFIMPWIQRPYDWTEEEATAMVEDFQGALLEGNQDGSERTNYLFGHMILSADGPMFGSQRLKYVIDGQQRLVTLCLLFSAARGRFMCGSRPEDAEWVADLKDLLLQKGNRATRVPELLRVQFARTEDSTFFRTLLLDEEFQRTPVSEVQLVGESQPKLWANLQLYRQVLAGMEPAEVEALVQFMLNTVVATVTTAATMADAVEYYNIMSQRGRQLQPVDVLKGCAFKPGAMPEHQQDEYGKKWAELERLQTIGGELGRTGLGQVCSHLVVIHTKKVRGTVNEYDELDKLFKRLTLKTVAASQGRAGPAFFDTVLRPYAEMYAGLLEGKYRLLQTSRTVAEVSALRGIPYLLTCFHRLRPLPNKEGRLVPPEWEPLLLAALMQHQLGRLSTAALERLLANLERLCWYWLLCRVGRRKQATRMLQALHELGLAGAAPPAGIMLPASRPPAAARAEAVEQLVPPIIVGSSCPSLQLMPEEAAEMLAALDGPVYKTLTSRICISLLVRLNEEECYLDEAFASTQPYDAFDKKLTVEHVLPQKPAADSDWFKYFADEEAGDWVHRLGNLVLLHGKLNSQASNKGFKEKKKDYTYKSRTTGGSSFPLTALVLQHSEWTPAAVAKQHSTLLALAKQCWELSPLLPRPAAVQPENADV